MFKYVINIYTGRIYFLWHYKKTVLTFSFTLLQKENLSGADSEADISPILTVYPHPDCDITPLTLQATKEQKINITFSDYRENMNIFSKFQFAFVFENFTKIDLEMTCIIFLKNCGFIWNAYWYVHLLYTVELHWLELEGTIKMCSSYRNSSHQVPVISERKKIWFWPGTVSLRYDKLMHSTVGLCRKKIFNPLEHSLRLRLLKTSLISSNVPRNIFFSLCSWSIL